MGTVQYTVINGEVMSELIDGVKRDYVPGPLGSTGALLDNSQAKTNTFEYWPHGESAARTGITTMPFQYVGTTGYYQDSSTRNYVRNRYLDGVKGRWITEDPLSRMDFKYQIVTEGMYLLEVFYFKNSNNMSLYSAQPILASDNSGLWIVDLNPFPPNNTKTCGCNYAASCDCNDLTMSCIDQVCCKHDSCIYWWDIWYKVPYCNARACGAALKCYLGGCSKTGRPSPLFKRPRTLGDASSGSWRWTALQVAIVECHF